MVFSRDSYVYLMKIYFGITSHVSDKLAYNDNAIDSFLDNIQFKR